LKPYHLYDDSELLRLLAEGDEKAFSEIYNRYWKKIYAIGYSRLKNVQLAEDILHDVFASLWKNREKAEINSLQNYLATASKYLVFAAIRKSIREQQYQAAQPEFSEELSSENELLYKQLAAFAAKEIESLPERCRLIFKYSREKGMSTREIALEMKISQKTVENQMNKALHRLRFSMRKILQLFF
jgi:RNA polymerase sigma-70 factor (family 1)